MAAVVPAPGTAFAQVAPTAVAVAPTCVVAGVATRMVILGVGWSNGAVELTQNESPLGTATARTSPVRQQAGSFSFSTTITADGPFRISARQGELVRSASVAAQSGCPLQISLKPPCLSGPGLVQVSGTGFGAGSQVPIDVDPFGNTETLSATVTADKGGTFSTSVNVPFTDVAVPIVATRPSTTGTAVIPPSRAVAFVDPCPPPPSTTTTTSTTRAPPGGTTTTTTGTVGPTTTTTTLPIGVPPPGVPPVNIPTPTPGDTAQVSISPNTVRPGRCNVIVVSAAPPALAVIVQYADGPPVTGQTNPAGGTVLSVCHPHDSGMPLGPVNVLIGIGPLAPTPVFTVLRVPARPQPPLLQSGADSRRS